MTSSGDAHSQVLICHLRTSDFQLNLNANTLLDTNLLVYFGNSVLLSETL